MRAAVAGLALVVIATGAEAAPRLDDGTAGAAQLAEVWLIAVDTAIDTPEDTVAVTAAVPTLGLVRDDLVRMVQGRAVRSVMDADAALETALEHNVDAVYLEVDRHGAPVVIRRKVIGKLAEAWHLAHGGGSPRITAAQRAELASDITQVDGDHWTVTAQLVSDVLADPHVFDNVARLHRELGANRGYRLADLRNDLVAHALGLHDGDVVTSVAGIPLVSDQGLHLALAALRTATDVDLALFRGKQALTLHYKIVRSGS